MKATVLVAAALGTFLAHESRAQADAGWQVTGTNLLRAERYGTRGDPAASPYRLDLGDMGYDELNVSGRLQDSPYSFWRFVLAGVVNGSPYRASHDGIVPERLALVRESGEAAIPFRFEAGDFFAFTSLRTQQRPLKGVSVELQPAPSDARLRQSIQVFAGAFQPSWRGAQWGDDRTLGASWLVDAGADGRAAATVLSGARAASGPLEERRQFIGSLAGETLRAFGDWKLRLEGEAATFRGDHEGDGLAVAGDRRDTGLYGQLSGFDGRWNWRLRAERYGRDYRPWGAAVTPDRRSAEAHLSYAFAGGMSLRGRWQDYRDQAESANPLESRVFGASLSGPLGRTGATVSADAFAQDQERRDGSLDMRFTSASATFSKAFAAGWVGQANVLRQQARDRLDASRDSRTTQAQASLIVPWRIGALAGSVSPGVLWRETRGSGATTERQPTLALALAGGAHRLALNAGRLSQAPRAAALPDVATANFALDYRYRSGPHELGFDWAVFDRDPSGFASTRAWRVGVSWALSLDAVAAPARRADAKPLAVAALTAAGVTRSPDLLLRLPPGAELDASVAALTAGGLGFGVPQPRAVVWEARLLPEIEQRQRLVVAHGAGRIERTVLVVSLEDAATGDDASRLHERVRRTLLDRFGSPSFTFDEGEFGPRFAADFAAGRFIRLTEWITQAGTVVRMGIPRRLDGSARIEIQHAARFPGPRDTLWGLESVR